MKKPLLLGIIGVTLIALTATTLYAQTVAGTSLVDKMKAVAHTFTLSADLNPGQTGFESAPVAGKKTGNILTAGEWNRMLEIVSQGSVGGGIGGNNSSIKAWITYRNIAGTVTTVGTPYGVQSATSGAGVTNFLNYDTIITLKEPLLDSNYAVIVSPAFNSGSGYYNGSVLDWVCIWSKISATSLGVHCAYPGYGAYGNSIVSVAVIGEGGGGSGGGTVNSPSNLVYINPDNTSFAPLTCTPGVNYMINPIAFSADSASSFTTRKVAVLGAGNWQVKGTGFVRIRNKNSDVGQTLRVSSVLDGTTTHLLDDPADAGMYANSFLDPVSVPAGKTTELRVSVKNNTLHGGNIVVWCN